MKDFLRENKAAVIVILVALVVFFGFFYENSTQKQGGAILDVCEDLYGAVEISANEYIRCLERGYACEFGYSGKYSGCCDEDDYSCEECNINKYDCSDFSDQDDAQYTYNYCKNFDPGVLDVHHLDSDNDGLACESYEYNKRTP